MELGCWPGGWLQVLAARVGPKGRVVGADLKPVDPLPGDAVRTLELDFTADGAVGAIREALGGTPDAVFSDAAPKLGGVREVDRAAIWELQRAALAIAEELLGARGTFVVKGFPGPEGDAFREALGERFSRVREVRPEGRRATSKEVYLVAERGPAAGRAAGRAGSASPRRRRGRRPGTR